MNVILRWSSLGKNDTHILPNRSFWGRYSLKWGITGQFTIISMTSMPHDQFKNMLR
jgi:hypothetical protein